jgi:hypothetical protein
MATTDAMQGGLDDDGVEIRIEGTLEADGTISRPVILQSAAASPARGDWYGIVVLAETEAFNVSQVDLSDAYRGVSLYSNDHIVAGSTIHDCSNAGVWVSGGTPSTDASGIAEVSLFYRTIGGGSFTELSMTGAGGDAFAVVLSGAAVAEPGLEYYLSATDAADPSNSANSPATAPIALYSFSVGLEPVDNEPSAIAHTPVTAEQVTGTSVAISAVAVDASGVASVTAYFRVTGAGGGWISTSLTNAGGTTWSGEISPLAVVEPGVEYYLIATDASDAANMASAPTDAPASYYSFAVSTPDTTAPSIAHTPVPDGQPESASVTVSATITDDAGIASATLYFRPQGEASWLTSSMSAAGDVWSASIPSFAISPPGAEYYIAALDGSDNTTTEPSTAPAVPHSFSVADSDEAGPSIVHTAVTTGIAGAELLITATITDASGVEGATLYFRAQGDTSWLSAAMAESGGTFSASIPSFAVSATGLQYYLRATDSADAGNASTSPAGAPGAWHNVSVAVPDTAGLTIELDAPIGPFVVGTPIPLTATVTDDAGVALVELSYITDGGEWMTLEMTVVAGDSYTVTIPGEDVTEGELGYYVTADDTLGNSSAEPAMGEEIIVVEAAEGADLDPPTLLHSPVTTPEDGTAVSIQAIATDASGVAYVSVFYAAADSDTFEEAALTQAGADMFVGEIPAEAVIGNALTYYVLAIDGSRAANEVAAPSEAPTERYEIVIFGGTADPEPDTGDVGQDAGPDVGDDVGADTGVDTGEHVGSDVEEDAGVDAGDDTGADAAPDAIPDLGGGGGGDTGVTPVDTGPGATADDGGCATASGGNLGFASILLGLVALRRRRRG